ncbi:hypothetical protein GCM10009721_10720 [Terrabacter tumescens]|uniref:Uncharacterized protein n=1 Tax=Terrabacter tumescens TaxID=60443 RepID=A0ABQ2HQ73_9MICO|nr:hypothetical protein [Terrabacter tumescens]GGM87624.1 hypothetical protein GCM10009721_10720 [Terrabacter tumescens]
METELFVHFAEIAGVFVGSGALISLRSTHVTDVHDVVYLQAALYVTALAAGVALASYTLLVYVMSQKHDATTGQDGA